jgi:DNA gyrase subunit A
VRPHQELLFISQEGMVQRTGVRGIRQTGRSAQGVTVMNVRDDDRVSAVALVVESEAPTSAAVAGNALDIDIDIDGDGDGAALDPIGAEDETDDGDLALEAPDLDEEDADDASADGNSPDGD